jgi:hypothetical protein
MDEPVCNCRALACSHVGICGKTAVIRLRVAIALGEGAFRPEIETVLCEECWDRIKLAFPDGRTTSCGSRE